MHSLLLVIFFASVVLILHTYLFYPLTMILFFPKPGRQPLEFSAPDELPGVAVLIAAYNEEKVIEEKIRSVFDTGYPLHKISVLVGSDASADRTDAIVEKLSLTLPGITLVKFSERVGKIGIINHLQAVAQKELLILTDANVMFTRTTIFELVKKFKDSGVGIVAANIIKESLNNEGIALQEKKYMSLENKIKAGESNAFQLIMGAEGGCYAMRNNLFVRVPPTFIVDDFFITLSVLNQHKQGLFNPAALCREDVSSDMGGEYRRKVRISSGNFQNLFHFRKNLLRFWTALGFSFWSHKVLRWLTPFLLITALLSAGLLANTHRFFMAAFLIQLVGFLSPLLNKAFSFKLHGLKFVSHFYLMNFALLEGFIKYAKGIKTSIWQPVKRNV